MSNQVIQVLQEKLQSLEEENRRLLRQNLWLASQIPEPSVEFRSERTCMYCGCKTTRWVKGIICGKMETACNTGHCNDKFFADLRKTINE